MNDLSDFCVYTVQLGSKWIVASNESPYFCFEAGSEDAALNKASAALEFYREAKLVEQQQERFEPADLDWHAVPARTLVAA